MALTTIQTNNKLIQFAKDINREFVRQNLFSPYMGQDLNAIIRIRQELKAGGEQMNIPLVSRLHSVAKGVGTLVGSEEKIDNYGMRVWLDWARNAVIINKAEQQKDSADLFGIVKPLLSDWGKELQRDELIAAFQALPSESQPAGLGSDNGQRTNGLLYEASSATQKNTWRTDNLDRVLYGSLVSNSATDHATSLSNILTTHSMSASNVSLMKRIAMAASPAIRPYKVEDGYEWYVCFAGLNTFRDLKSDLKTTQTTALLEMGRKSPLFQDGDLLWDGVIIRQVPEISGFVTDVWTSLTTAGSSSTRVEPVYFCGQQAAAFCWGQMARPTERKEDDYGFVTGVGVDMAYGVAKMFRKGSANGASSLTQWGVLQGYFSGAVDG